MSGSGELPRATPSGLPKGAWWDPRRSLASQLLALLVGVVVVPAAVYHVVSERAIESNERELTERLVSEGAASERRTLRNEAERRAQELEERAAEVQGALREAVTAAAASLRAPPPGGPPEVLVVLPGGVRYTADRGTSAVALSAVKPGDEEKRRDLARTRRLETTFSALIAGHAAISAVFVMTSSGVLRVVPWRDMAALFGPGGMPADFRVRDRFPDPGPDAPQSEVFWTSLYDDRYSRRGRIVSALAPLRSGGRLIGVVGIDWALESALAGSRDVRRAGEIEILWSRDGKTLVRMPGAKTHTVEARAFPASRENGVYGVASRQPETDVETRVGGEPLLVAGHRLAAVPWTYGRVLSLSVLERSVRRRVEPAFATARQRGRRSETIYLALLTFLAGALVAISRRATAPIRRVASFADAITHGRSPPELTGEDRVDEVGLLARAMRNLEQRTRRRIRSLEGAHDLARAASAMTRPEETYQKLSRRIAELVGATKCWLCLWDGDTRSLDFQVPGYGVADECLRGLTIELSHHGMAVLAFRTGELCATNDVASDPRVSQELRERTGVTENAAFAPLKTDVGPLGVLIVADKLGGFDAEDRAAIQSYANQAALLLRNARLYEELQRSYERLRDAQRHRDTFLQDINHELRTPLTAIVGWSEVLAEDRPGPDTVAAALEQIRRSAEFLLNLISDLLDLSRLEDGGVRIERVLTDLGALTRDAIEPVAVMAEGKGISLQVTAPQVGDVEARLDPIRMKQVLWNLVHNAVKFTPRAGTIKVTAGAEGDAVTFTVSDDGTGIDPKDLPHVFERFHQGDGSAVRAHRGTGIGLALAKGYVEAHGGTIAVESQPGRGATFRIRIPTSTSSGKVKVLRK